MPTAVAQRARIRRGAIPVIVAVLVSSLLSAVPAAATFSGTSGRLAFFDEDDWITKTVNADGSGVANLGNAQDLSYSSDGTQIAFRHSSRIYIADADGTDVAPVTTHPSESDLTDWDPVWVDGDTKLVFNREDWMAGTTELHVINLDGSGLDTISPAAETGWTVFGDREPAVSPDGETVAFIRDQENDGDFTYEQALMTVGFDGTDPQRVAMTGAEWSRSVSWSPDGSKLAVEAWSSDDNDGIYVVDSTGGAASLLPNAENGEDPVWSPDGTKIAYIRYDDGTDMQDLLVADVSGASPQAVSGAGWPVNPEWQACASTCPALDYDLDDDGTSNLDEHFGEGGGDPEPEISTACTTDPLSNVQSGLQNTGFESGELTPWREGTKMEGHEIISGSDALTSGINVNPWEGSKMLRLGAKHADDDSTQSPGRNEICQDFTVTNTTETFAFNIFTFDYSGFDELQFNVKVREPDTGELLASYRQEAWGPSSDTSLKTTGWRGATLNLAGHVGEKVRLQISAGGTSDSSYAFWAYIDSAAPSHMPPAVVSSADIKTTTGSVYTDPTTGQVTVTVPNSQKSAVTLTSTPSCDSGTLDPSSVTMLLGGTPFAMAPVSPGSAIYSVTIQPTDLTNGTLTMTFSCSGATNIKTVGQIELYDPSGFVRNAVTNAPIKGASVTLFKVPDWEPGTDCEISQTTWTQPAPTSLGVKVSPYSNEISPNINPQSTTSSGYYGWDVAQGCWYVEVTATHFKKLVSPVVGVPPEVTNLHLKLQPVVYGRTASLSVPSKVTTRKVGQLFDLAGIVKPAAGAPTTCRSGVPVKITKDGKTVTTIKAAADGRYAVKVAAVTNGLYRAVTDAAGHCAAATSSAVKLSVAKVVTLKASAKKVTKDKTVTLTTTAKPGKKGEVITLFKKTAKGLKKLTTAKANKKGVAVFTRTMKAKMTFVTRSASTATHVAALSPARTVKVIR